MYHKFATSLQVEWQYLCRCVPGVGQHLAPVEAAIRMLLIPALLQVKPGDVKNELHTLQSHGFKTGGKNLRNPGTGADRLFQASEDASGVLMVSLLGGTALDSVTHRAQQVRGVGAAAQKDKMAPD